MANLNALAHEVDLAQVVPNILTPPPAPKDSDITISQVTSGVQSARTEYVIITTVNSYGESPNSSEFVIEVSSSKVLVVTYKDSNSPGGATGWNCYVSKSSGTETAQNTVPLALGATFQEPATGLISGTALPNNAVQYPSYVNNPSGVTNTPPATGALVPPQSPSGSVTGQAATYNYTNTITSTERYVTLLVTAMQDGVAFNNQTPVTPGTAPNGASVGLKEDVQTLPAAPSGTFSMQGATAITNLLSITISYAGIDSKSLAVNNFGSQGNI